MEDTAIDMILAVVFGCLLALVTKWLLIREPLTRYQFCVITLLWSNMLLSEVRDKFYHKAWWDKFTKNTCNNLDDNTSDDSDNSAGEVSNG